MENTPPVATPEHPKFVRWALLVGIVIILNIFFFVLVSIVFPTPIYEKFCPTTQVIPTYETKESCLSAGGQWTNAPTKQSPRLLDTTPPLTGYCDSQYTCRMAYTSANEGHAQNAFIAFVVLGVLALVAGLLPIGSSIVSSGLSYGGVIALIIGSIQYWGSAGQWIRLAIATLGLFALLYIGWRRFRD